MCELVRQGGEFRRHRNIRGGHLRLVLDVGAQRRREASGEAHIVGRARHLSSNIRGRQVSRHLFFTTSKIFDKHFFFATRRAREFPNVSEKDIFKVTRPVVRPTRTQTKCTCRTSLTDLKVCRTPMP